LTGGPPSAFTDASNVDRQNRRAFDDVSLFCASNQRTGFDIALLLKNNFA